MKIIRENLKKKEWVFIRPDIDAFWKATENVWKDFASQAWGQIVYEEIQKLR